jgi:anti-anti-sigma regulatory factor
MSCEFAWFQKQHILFVKMTGTLKVIEIQKISDTITFFVEQAPSPTDLIVDITKVTSFDGIACEVLDASPYLRHARLGWLVVVGRPNRVMRIILATLSRRVGARIRLTDSLEEAVAFLGYKHATPAVAV